MLHRGMPWRETVVMDERARFVLRAREAGSNVSALAREFGVSRKTAYKWLERYAEAGVAGLEDMSRRPHRAVSLSGECVLQILEVRRRYPHWGPRKLVHVLKRKGVIGVPSARSIARVLERADIPLIRVRRPKAPASSHASAPTVAPVSRAEFPNALWTVDFKGWWRAIDGTRCEPLTVRDASSRFVLCAKLMRSQSASTIRAEFERLFAMYGLPEAILVDNGVPFVSTQSRGGLTVLSAWWVSLGIRLVRSRLGHPEDNGAHERMHGDMKFELELSPRASFATQQRALDEWRTTFNDTRPHEALAMQVPASQYRKSKRIYQGGKIPQYPRDVVVRKVSMSGRIWLAGGSAFISRSLAGHNVALRARAEGGFELWFHSTDLGVVAADDFIPRGEVHRSA